MELKRLGPSMTELELADGTRVLFSYETPVAAYVPPGLAGRVYQSGWVKTDKFFSRTTSHHVAGWLRKTAAPRIHTVPHDELVRLARGVR